MKFSPRVQQIAGEGAAAWAIHEQALAERARGEDIIVLSVGDPDLATPRPIVERAQAALDAGDTHYPEVLGRDSLRTAIAQHFAAHGGLPVTADNVCVVSGAQNGLFMASMLLLDPGDEALMLCPGYVTYEATIRASGATPVVVDMEAAGGFRPDAAAIEAAVTPRTRALFLITPNNPTGVVLDAAELAAIADIARRHNLWVVSDEVYAGLVFEGEHRSIAALPDMAERTITVSSLSKSHAMTGWRSGWLIAPEPFIQHAGNLALCALYGLPGFVQQAAETALEQAHDITAHHRDILRARRDRMYRGIASIPGLRPLQPQAGLFLMLDISGTGLSGERFAWRLLAEQGVSVLDARAFGDSAAGFVRLSYGLDEARIDEACRRIAAFCESSNTRSESRESIHG